MTSTAQKPKLVQAAKSVIDMIEFTKDLSKKDRDASILRPADCDCVCHHESSKTNDKRDSMPAVLSVHSPKQSPTATPGCNQECNCSELPHQLKLRQGESTKTVKKRIDFKSSECNCKASTSQNRRIASKEDNRGSITAVSRLDSLQQSHVAAAPIDQENNQTMNDKESQRDLVTPHSSPRSSTAVPSDKKECMCLKKMKLKALQEQRMKEPSNVQRGSITEVLWLESSSHSTTAAPDDNLECTCFERPSEVETLVKESVDEQRDSVTPVSSTDSSSPPSSVFSTEKKECKCNMRQMAKQQTSSEDSTNPSKNCADGCNCNCHHRDSNGSSNTHHSLASVQELRGSANEKERASMNKSVRQDDPPSNGPAKKASILKRLSSTIRRSFK